MREGIFFKKPQNEMLEKIKAKGKGSEERKILRCSKLEMLESKRNTGIINQLIAVGQITKDGSHS